MMIQRAISEKEKIQQEFNWGNFLREDDWVGSFGLIKIQREGNKNNMSKGV